MRSCEQYREHAEMEYDWTEFYHENTFCLATVSAKWAESALLLFQLSVFNTAGTKLALVLDE